MDLRIRNIRFSKDYFVTYEECAKWLENKNFEELTYSESDSFFIFIQTDSTRFTDNSIQDYKLDNGVFAEIGVLGENGQSLDNISDNEPATFEDISNQPKQIVDAFDQMNQAFMSMMTSISEQSKTFADTINQITSKVSSKDEAINKNSDSSEKVSLNVSILKADEEKRHVYGEVLIPSEWDAQEHIYSSDEVEKAAHYWLMNYQTLGEMHEEELSKKQIKVIESYIAPISFKFSNTDDDTQKVKKGTWLIKVYVADDDIWEKVKSGEYTGFSMGGVATVYDLDENSDIE